MIVLVNNNGSAQNLPDVKKSQSFCFWLIYHYQVPKLNLIIFKVQRIWFWAGECVTHRSAETFEVSCNVGKNLESHLLVIWPFHLKLCFYFKNWEQSIMVFIMHCYKNNCLIFLMKVVQKLAIESKTFIWNDQYTFFGVIYA